MPDPRVPELVAALDRACRAAGFDDYMPGGMIGHFVRQVSPSSLDGDRFLLNQFYQWVRQEYSIPDSAFGRAFNLFGPDAAKIGVTAIEPAGFDPGFGETIRSWLIGVVDGNQGEAAAAAAAPQIPIADTEHAEVLPADYELPMDPAQAAPPEDTAVNYGEPVTDETADYAQPAPEELPAEAYAEPATEAATDEPVTYGVAVDKPESPVEVIASEPLDAEADQVPVPIDDSAILAEDAPSVPALVIEPPASAASDPSAPGSPDYCTPEDELAALRAEVAEELRKELWPVVYEEVRSLVAGEVRPALETEVRKRLEAELRPEVTRALTADLRDELYARLHEEVTAELRASEHAPVAEEVRGRVEASVREELRRELWDEVRAEVKDDLRSVMGQAIVGAARGQLPAPVEGVEDFTLPLDLPEPAPPPAAPAALVADDDRGLGLGADDQLLIIRRLRERLAPAIREQFARELTDLACCLREAESEKEREARLSDPDYCREQVRQYFFPDQPVLWEKVRPHVDPARWRQLVGALARGDYDRDKLGRVRPAVREALILKAEIDGEMGSAPPRGVPRPRVLAEALAGADRALDFALDSLSETINGI